jgi:hypothetical protein
MALLPPFFLDTVVAIGVGDDPNKRYWIGTGFIFGKYIEGSDKNGRKKSYCLWLVTNKHVFINCKTIYIKFNSAQDTKSKDYRVNLIARNGRPYWVGHPNKNIDIAVIFLSAKFLEQECRLYKCFHSDEHIMDKKKMCSKRVTEGDRIFVLGFPMNLVSPERQYVICRGGYISRIRDFLENKSEDFLIDAAIFPGNSGGPVIICPSALAIRGTNPIDKACLIGIVKSYIPYSDIALSQQTGIPRIQFMENSGLALVESVDSIIDTIIIAEKRYKKRRSQAKRRSKKFS